MSLWRRLGRTFFEINQTSKLCLVFKKKFCQTSAFGDCCIMFGLKVDLLKAAGLLYMFWNQVSLMEIWHYSRISGACAVFSLIRTTRTSQSDRFPSKKNPKYAIIFSIFWQGVTRAPWNYLLYSSSLTISLFFQIKNGASSIFPHLHFRCFF